MIVLSIETYASTNVNREQLYLKVIQTSILVDKMFSSCGDYSTCVLTNEYARDLTAFPLNIVHHHGRHT